MVDTIQMTVGSPIGEVVEVPLQRYATAGYVWKIETVPPGVADLQIVPRGAGDTPGAAMAEVLRLRGTTPGEHEVVLILRRPWETEPAQEVRIKVKVE